VRLFNSLLDPALFGLLGRRSPGYGAVLHAHSRQGFPWSQIAKHALYKDAREYLPASCFGPAAAT
jgi:hypothetical protein